MVLGFLSRMILPLAVVLIIGVSDAVVACPTNAAFGFSSQAAKSGLLSVGSYATYEESNLSLSYLTGVSTMTGPFAQNSIWLVPGGNKTAPFDALRLRWRIDRADSSSYEVNYTLEFLGSSPFFTISQEVIVSTLNGSAYGTNGSYIGTWPYWLPSSLLAPGSNITLIHDYPVATQFPNRTFGVEYASPPQFTSLSLGNGQPFMPQTGGFVDDKLSLTGIGTFKTDRLIVTYAYAASVSSDNGVMFVTPAPIEWDAIYDRFSGVMLAFSRQRWFTEDIMLHGTEPIWQVGFGNSSIVLVSTNLSISSDTQAGIAPLIMLAVGVGACVVVVAYVVVRTRSSASGGVTRKKGEASKV